MSLSPSLFSFSIFITGKAPELSRGVSTVAQTTFFNLALILALIAAQQAPKILISPAIIYDHTIACSQTIFYILQFSNKVTDTF